jgi:hypothetical protein
MTLAELARESTLIVDAHVIAIHPVADTGRIERVITLRVGARWKGESDDVLHLRLPGGTLGRLRTVVPGVPDFTTGERLVLFLDEVPGAGPRILGLHQGAWRVQPSPVDGRVHVAPAVTGLSHGGPVVRGDAARRPRSIERFRTEVADILGGTP